MNSENCKSICEALLRADDEEEVVKILQDNGLWEDERNWRYYGDDELNWNRAGNQQIRSDFALNEKLVNTIDSRLMLECMLQGISPESSKAPQSIREGISRFIEKSSEGALKVTAGRIEDWPPTYRTQVANNMVVFTTGSNSKSLCINIADLGEGQTPAAFPNTLLSLGQNNKIRVNFVQGKFGQGSTGAIRFCGDRKLQMIISKRHPGLLNNPAVSSDYPIDESDDCWGFTIVRREGSGLNVRSPFYSYLAPIDAELAPRLGRVMRFRASEMPIFPEGNAAYARGAEHGTLIKLYNYRLKGTSHILRRDGLRGKIDLLLTQPALPLRFHECRPRFKSDREQVETMSGLFSRLRGNTNLEEIKPSTIRINVGGHDLPAKIFAFKPNTSQTYRKSEGVIFSINGQTQGYIKASFFSRKSLGLQKIAKDLLVVLDCSAFNPIEQDDLFMPSRDRLVEDNDLAMEIEHKLEYALKHHPGLRALKNERATLDTQEKLADDKPLEDTVNEIIRNDPILASVFGKGLRLPKVKKPEEVKPSSRSFESKPHPTYFRFATKDQGAVLKRSIQVDRRARIAFDTDAEDEYFDRKVDAGTMEIIHTVGGVSQTISNYVHYLVEGRANVYLDLPSGTKVGDVLEFAFVIRDPVTGNEFWNNAKLSVLAKADTSSGPPSRRKKPDDQDGSGAQGNAGIEMPKVRWVSQEEENWATFFNTTDDCLSIFDEGEEKSDKWKSNYEFFLNEANKAFQLQLRNSKFDPATVKKQFEVGVVLIGLAMIHDDNQRNGSNEREYDFEEFTLEKRTSIFTRAIAPVLIPIIQSLGPLAEEEVDASDLAGQAA